MCLFLFCFFNNNVYHSFSSILNSFHIFTALKFHCGMLGDQTCRGDLSKQDLKHCGLQQERKEIMKRGRLANKCHITVEINHHYTTIGCWCGTCHRYNCHILSGLSLGFLFSLCWFLYEHPGNETFLCSPYNTAYILHECNHNN